MAPYLYNDKLASCVYTAWHVYAEKLFLYRCSESKVK